MSEAPILRPCASWECGSPTGTLGLLLQPPLPQSHDCLNVLGPPLQPGCLATAPFRFLSSVVSQRPNSFQITSQAKAPKEERL